MWGLKTGGNEFQFLKPGENTLNVQICRVLIDSLNEKGGYDEDDFARRYIDFMTTPGNHNDTYIEECHRNFFSNYAKGLPISKCGVEEKHIGGLIGIVPIVCFYFNDRQKARDASLTHLALTHPGAKMKNAAILLIDMIYRLLNGVSLTAVILEMIESQANSLLGHPYGKWLKEPDDWVIGPRLSTACYVEDSVPAVIYLALKYHNDPTKALIVNTNLGGDNAGRGAVLGALFGAAYGDSKFPSRWKSGVASPLPDIISRPPSD